MTRLHLMRHAEQELGPGDAPDQTFSAGDRDLSDRGRRQARAARDVLAEASLDACIASPYTRCRQTARIVAEPHGLEVVVEDRFAEIPFVDADVRDHDVVLDGIQAFAEALQAGDDPVLASGRPWSAIRADLVDAFDEVAAGHGRPLVVAHGGVNRALIAAIRGWPDHRMFDLRQPYACINRIAVDDGEATVESVADVPWRGKP